MKTTTKIAAYLRISDDQNGTQEATRRQREDLSKYATKQGFEIVVYEDVDVSASKRKVRRPQFEKMLEDIGQTIHGVLVWRTDRLCRQPRDYVRLEDAFEDNGGFLISTDEGLDTRDSVGRRMFWYRVLQAKEEAENISARTRRAHEQIAKEGRYSGGGHRPFGYTFRMEVIPEEAELIKEAADKVLADTSVRSLCIDWEKRGILSPAGRPWQEVTLRRTLMKDYLVGKRIYKGATFPGTWHPILSEEQSAQLKHLLGDASRRTTQTYARSHLLSGFLRCGRCGARLIARPTSDKRRRYVCQRQPGLEGCGRLSRLAEPVEDVVAEMVAASLDYTALKKHRERQEQMADAELVASIKADERQLEQLAKDHNVDRIISRREWLAARDLIQSRLEQSRKAMGRRAGNAVLKEVYAGFNIREQWASRPLDWKRLVLATMLEKVIIHPTKVRGSRRFDPRLIEPVWRF